MTKPNGNGKRNGKKAAAIPAAPVLVPQPHGGALASGGYPGNKAGRNGGRPPDRFRKEARKLIRERKLLPRVADMADGSLPEVPYQQQLGAAKMLVDVGLGEMIPVSDVRRRVSEQLAVIRSRDTWTPAELIEAFEPIWRD